MYFYGKDGIQRNDPEAMRLFWELELDGFAPVNYILGQVYQFGYGEEINADRAIAFYRVAIENPNYLTRNAHNNLGDLLMEKSVQLVNPERETVIDGTIHYLVIGPERMKSLETRAIAMASEAIDHKKAGRGRNETRHNEYIEMLLSFFKIDYLDFADNGGRRFGLRPDTQALELKVLTELESAIADRAVLFPDKYAGVQSSLVQDLLTALRELKDLRMAFVSFESEVRSRSNESLYASNCLDVSWQWIGRVYFRPTIQNHCDFDVKLRAFSFITLSYSERILTSRQHAVYLQALSTTNTHVRWSGDPDLSAAGRVLSYACYAAFGGFKNDNWSDLTGSDDWACNPVNFKHYQNETTSVEEVTNTLTGLLKTILLGSAE